MSDTLFFDLPNCQHTLVVFVRLAVAVVFGGVIGFEREHARKAAALRTHMLVSVGSALFVLASFDAGASVEHLTRVVQGLATGIGFLGGGMILKLRQEQLVRGLTTAATIWATAAIGVAVGLGAFWPAFFAVVLSLVVLYVLRLFETSGQPGPHNPHQV